VNERLPGGLTRLMDVTVAGGAGLDTSIDNEEEEGQDATTNMISELVSQGAELNATLEKTGETSLHLAARYARADAAKRLLDMGADVNFQDNTGRTPLHAAVAADAMGAFQVCVFLFYNEERINSSWKFDSID
jgi:ankyrin repeat protein